MLHKDNEQDTIGFKKAPAETFLNIDQRSHQGPLWLPKGQKTGNTQPQAKPEYKMYHANAKNRNQSNHKNRWNCFPNPTARAQS